MTSTAKGNEEREIEAPNYLRLGLVSTLTAITAGAAKTPMKAKAMMRLYIAVSPKAVVCVLLRNTPDRI
jgi:hypothetical protein